MKIITIFIFLFFSFIVQAELPFQGTWSGKGNAVENGELKPIEKNLTITAQDINGDTHFNGFASLTLDIFDFTSQGTFDWLNSKSEKIGSGYCVATSCSFVGRLEIGETVFTFAKTFTVLDSKLYVSEVTSSSEYTFATNMVLNKAE